MEMSGVKVTVPTIAESATLAGSNARPLAVVVVTYNSAEVLGGLLDSLFDGLEGIRHSEIVVADNASADASVAVARSHPIGARVVTTGWNGGYAVGVNAALATIKADADVLILNPDIRLSRGVAARLVGALCQPDVAIAVPRILHENGALVHSLRREPSLLTAWSDAFLGAKLGAGLDWGESIFNPDRYRIPGFVDWASGAALAVSASARQRIGKWDESFFLYSEEVDYQRRARLAGYRVAYVPEADVVHFGGDYRTNTRLYAILTTNRIRDYARHHGTLSTALFRLAVLAGEGLRSLGGSAVHRAGMGAALQRPPLSSSPGVGEISGAGDA